MILVELVPRTLNDLSETAAKVLTQFPMVDGVNIPDVLRLDHRSHDAATHLMESGTRAIPHIRSMDRELSETVKIAKTFYDAGGQEILVITGDAPKNPLAKTFSVTPVDVVKAVKAAVPKLKVYCGLDPYRSSLQKEIAYARAKIDAGADGLFTQPFFDAHMAQVYLNQLTDTSVFIGASPVTSERSKQYWETVNRVVFSPQFSLDLPANCQVAKDLVSVAKSANQHIYLMPITVDPVSYLSGIF